MLPSGARRERLSLTVLADDSEFCVNPIASRPNFRPARDPAAIRVVRLGDVAVGIEA
ncbi:MAG TPA: hypothetical protein VKU19_00115 [Bryobacteraceae bacterium]|nr:hypothetical protein [Bryobacteraceae bacterium]